MVVWQGLGALGFLIPGILYHLFNYGADTLYGAGYSRTHTAPAVIGLLVSAVLVTALGFWLDSYSKKIAGAPKNGWERICRGRHTLFFIPMHWVPIGIVAIAVWLTVHHPGANYQP
jgi:hypothetical protein